MPGADRRFEVAMSVVTKIATSTTRPPGHETATSRVFAQITPDVYAGLRRLARLFMRGERGGHTLQPTAVVNEAFLRLSRARVDSQDALHLFRLVAHTMRRVLVDHARERKRLKRTASADDPRTASVGDPRPSSESLAPLDVLDIDAALDELGRRAPRAAAFLELRYFAGLDAMELAELYGVSRPTVEREFRFAKAFLVSYGRRRPASDSLPM